MLPGVPIEMRGLLTRELIPRFRRRTDGTVVRSRTLRATGIPESTLGEMLDGLEERLAPLTLAYLPSLMGTDLRLTAWNLSSEEADRRLEAGMALLREHAGHHVYGEEADDLAAVLLQRARERGSRLVVAESCTGGAGGGADHRRAGKLHRVCGRGHRLRRRGEGS